jgi:hypothetical protein
MGSRRVRPLTPRTSPNRSIGAERRGTNAADSRVPPPAEPASEPSGAAGAATAATADPHDGANRTLNDAYRLVDEYLRQGQKMAENVWLPSGASGSSFDAGLGAPGRFMRAMGDMTLAWVEVMQQFANGAAPAREAPVGSAGAFKVNQAPAPATVPTPSVAAPNAAEHAAELTVRVQASGRVEVSVQLGELSNAAHLAPTELRSFTGHVESIRDVSLIVMPGAAPVLQIVVPDGQPAGTYNGLLLDAKSQKPRGTVSLSVL